MNKDRKTLGQLFAAQEDTDGGFDSAQPDNTETEKEAKDKKDDDQDSDDDDDQDDKEKDKKKKPFGSTDDDKKKDADTDPVAGDAGTVVLALEDYDKLISLASEAKTAKADSARLKAKADKWDSYQAAVAGNKAGADTAGASFDSAQDDSKDPDAALRKKYGKLMEDC